MSIQVRRRVRVRDGVRVRLLCLNSMFRLWFRLDNDHTSLRSNHSVSEHHRMRPSQSDLSETKVRSGSVHARCCAPVESEHFD